MVGNNVGGKPAIAGKPREERLVAQVLQAGTAIAAMSAGKAQPRHANSPSKKSPIGIGADSFDNSDDFMSGYQGKFRMIEFSVDHVEVSATNGASLHTYADFARTWARVGKGLHDQGCPRLFKYHRLHRPPQLLLKTGQDLLAAFGARSYPRILLLNPVARKA
ncbi:hypothetical protein N183_26385 [Sinorhizobium sp. Sb3]|nr:hypothetical protein N183_26385 [Sinorhizobium sp. Sb3]